MAFPTKVIPLSDAFKQWLSATFAPKVHYHDDRYSLLGHTHDGTNVTIGRDTNIGLSSFVQDNTKYPTSNGGSASNVNNITVDESCEVNILKNTNGVPNQFRINGEMIDVKEDCFDNPSINYVTIGQFVIVCGTTPRLDPRSGAVNQLIRIKIPDTLRTLFSANLTAINYWNTTVGVETVPLFVAFQDNWLYVYLDGNGNANPITGVSFTLFGKQ